MGPKMDPKTGLRFFMSIELTPRGLKCRYSKDEEGEEAKGENAPQGMELEALANNGNAINI